VRIAIDANAARMQMKVEDGDEGLLKPGVLIFNECGLENVRGLRNAMDGITHFGSKKTKEEVDKKLVKR
jgi:hypothetical protein